MTMRLTTLAFILALAGCGGGGGGGSPNPTQPGASVPPEPTPTLDTNNNEYRIHAGQTIADAKRSPVYRTGSLTRVGVDQGPAVQRLPRTSVPGMPDLEVRHGTLRDGAGGADLKAYLQSVVGQHTGLSRRLPAYQVRVIGESTAEERQRILSAVRLVNAALPESAKLTMGSPLPNFSLWHTVTPSGIYFGRDEELPNTIQVEFGPEGVLEGSTAATSWGEYILFERGTFPAYADERKAVILTAHELIHSMGVGGHVPDSFATIMEGGNRVYDSHQEQRQPGSLLYPIDREALRALYGPLRHSSDPQNLGSWSGTSEHFFVKNAHGAFGVANRNGYAEPWAYGVTPATRLAANRQLSGIASWTGALVGFTPSSKRVAGEADITVNLGSMAGSAAFTGLSTIEANGTTPRWGDGDLRYRIAVRGNTFRETGGDAGRLTGAFAGRSHESAGGTLERHDLTAAFGAER